jgi:hypothetical protein
MIDEVYSLNFIVLMNIPKVFVIRVRPDAEVLNFL